MLTHDDLREVERLDAQLRDAQQAALDLAERFSRKGDHPRGAAIEVHVSWPCERARKSLEQAIS